MQFFSAFVSNVSIPRCIIAIYMAHYKVIMIALPHNGEQQ